MSCEAVRNKAGNLVHEVEWAGALGYSAWWIIAAADVAFAASAYEAAP